MAVSFTLISRHWWTPDRTSDNLLRRAASRAHCITKPEENTDNNPSESANCNLRWPPRLSRGTFTPRKEIFLPRPFSRHSTAIHPSSSPAIISSRRLAHVISFADFVFKCSVDPHCAAADPPLTRINPFNWDHPYSSKRRVDPRPDWTTGGGTIRLFK